MRNDNLIDSYQHGIFTVKVYADSDSDTSDLGKFTNKPNWSESNRYKVYDRKMTGHMGYNEYRYFQSAYDLIEAQEWFTQNGYSKHESYTIPLKQDKENYERAERFGRDWNYVGIVIEYKGERLASHWGIESDFPYDDIIEELVSEAKHELKRIASEKEYPPKRFHFGYKQYRKSVT